MTTRGGDHDKSATGAAGEWIARLRAPDRDEETEQAFRRWRDSDPSHADAFNRATEVWEALGSLESGWTRRRPARALVFGAVAAGLAAVLLLAVVLLPFLGLTPVRTYATAVGEQRVVVLEDGSQVAMNTNSEIRVRYTRDARRLELARGEAIFDVAKNPRRPFTVRAEGHEVRALGTSFLVSRAGYGLKVTLIEGKVTISSAPEPSARTATATLTAGEEWRATNNIVSALDPKRLEAATSWRRQEVIFDETPLADAIAEMNRYTSRPIVVTGTLPPNLRISGIFHTRDAASFAHTISLVYGIEAS